MGLAEIRKQKNLSAANVAARAGVSESFYSLIENGKRRPSVPVAKKIAAALGFDWTMFYEDESESA